MTKVRGNGAPTRKTRGGVGDIYTNTKTGEQYKCTFAYRSDPLHDYDYEWTKIEEEDEKLEETEVPEMKREAGDTIPETTEDTVQSEPVVQEHTGYASYYNKNKNKNENK